MQRNPLNRPSASCYHFLAASMSVGTFRTRPERRQCASRAPHPEPRGRRRTLVEGDQSWSERRRLSWTERICPERHLALPLVPCHGLPVPYWSLLPAKHGLGETHPERPPPLPMLIVGQRGRVDESIERVLHTAVDYPDGLHETGQVSTRQQAE